MELRDGEARRQILCDGDVQGADPALQLARRLATAGGERKAQQPGVVWLPPAELVQVVGDDWMMAQGIWSGSKT